MRIRIQHRKMTDEEMYQEIRKFYRENPDLHHVLMKPSKWKQKQVEQNRREGKSWSG